MNQYPICVECGRGLRPYGSTKDDHPGTVQRGTADTCLTCYKREARSVVRGVLARERTALKTLTAEQRAHRVGIVYPPAGNGWYPVICKSCGWRKAFKRADTRRKKAWSHVLIHEETM